jgi:N-methylhydantoinase A
VQTVATPLKVSLQDAAEGIYDIANENMMGALRLISVQQGYDPREFALVAFGGAGPLHANALGKLLGSWPVIVPPSPGVLCAFGDATTRLRAERARSLTRTFSALTDAEMKSQLSQLAEEVTQDLEAEGVPRGDQELLLEAGVRYSGQAFEVTRPVRLEDFSGGGLEKLGAAFDAEHERAFTFKLDADRELVTLRATTLGKASAIEVSELPVRKAGSSLSDAVIRSHKLWADGVEHDATIYDRGKLLSGDVIPGPAIVAEMDATTVVLPQHAATVDRFGNLLIRPV